MKCNKSISLIIIFAVLIQSVFSVSVYAKTNYFRTGFTDNDVLKYAQDAVIMRAKCSEFYDCNIREAFEDVGKLVTPIIQDGTYYVPVIKTLEALDILATQSDNEILIEDNSLSSIVQSEGAIIIRNGAVMADANELAVIAGKHCKIVQDIVFFTDIEVDEIPIGIVKKIQGKMSYEWQNVYLGPEGYVTGVIAHPKNKELIYARTDVGGIYRLDRTTMNWIPLMDTITQADSNLISVLGVALDPNDDNIIYAACGSRVWTTSPHDILKSYDKGKNWERLEFKDAQFNGNTGYVRLTGECIAVDPKNSNVVYCGTSANGLYISDNAGASFTKVSSIPTGGLVEDGAISFVKIDDSEEYMGRSKTVYVGMFGEGVYVSHDGGRTFMLTKNSPKLPCRGDISDSKLYITARCNAERNESNTKEFIGGFYCYDNGKWIDLTPEDWHNKGFNAMIIDKTNPSTIIISGTPYGKSNEIFRTFDGGKSWESLGIKANFSTFIQDPINPKGFWAPWGFGIYYVENMYAKRLSYEACDLNIEELCATQLLTNPSNEAPMLLTLVMDKGTMISDRIDTRALRMKPYMGKGAGIDLCEQDPSIVYRVGFVTDVYGESISTISNDYGNTFYEIPWDNSKRIIDAAISATKQENGFPILMNVCLDKDKGIYMSKDMGNSWKKCSGVSVKSNSGWDFHKRYIASDKVDGNAFYYLDDSDFWVTLDGGENWSKRYVFKKNTNKTYYANEFMKTIPGVEGGIWIRRDEGIYVSYDKGQSFKLMKNVTNPCSYGFGIGKPDTKVPAAYMYATVGGEEGLFISDDLGNNWRRINDNGNGFSGDIYDIAGDRIQYGRVFVISSGRGTMVGQPIGMDDHTPIITSETQSSSDSKISANYATGDEYFTVTGSVNEPCEVRVNGQTAEVDGYNHYSCKIRLNPGENKILIEAKDKAGLFAEPKEIMIRYIENFTSIENDTTPPKITLDDIPETVPRSLYVLRGRLDEAAEVRVNGQFARVNEDFSFYASVELEEGKNTIKVQARDYAKNACKPIVNTVFYSTDNSIDTAKLYSERLSQNFVFDGLVDEWELDKYCDKIMFGNVNNQAQFNTMWDDEYLYIAVKVVDDIIYIGNSTIYNNDNIEVYIDGNNHKGKSYDEFDKQYCWHVNPEYDTKDSKFRLNAEGYTAEVRIPWKELNIDITKINEIGFDIDMVDNDTLYGDNGSRSGAIGWHGTSQDWTDPSVFATLIFKR